MKLIKAVCAVLLFSLMASLFFTFFVSAEENSDYNYSSPSATLAEKIYADDFIKEYVRGVTLSDVEAAFIREQSGFLLAYNSGIPTSSVETTYEDGTLTVKPKEYKYTAENGVEVIWKPVSVELYSEKKALSEGNYQVQFSGFSARDKDFVKVEYRASFVIKKEDVNRLINFAYNSAPALKAEIEAKTAEYEEKSAQYEIDRAAYNEYLADLAVYQTYEAARREYLAKYAEYQNYVKEWNEYSQAKDKHESYLIALKKYNQDYAKYEKYLAYKEHNLAKAEAYEQYLAKYAVVSAQIDIIKKLKTPVTELNRTVYDAIMGNTVTDVIKNKGDIVDVLKADPKIVDAAGEATEILRELFKGFFDIKNTQGQYEYYINNYESFRDNFIKLLQTLDALYNVEGVKGALELKEKEEKYIILVAQLYYVANALSDEPVKSYRGNYVYDASYQIGRSYPASKRHYPCDVITENYIVDTNNARPLEGGYPIFTGEVPDVLPVEKPTAPEYVAEPTAPTPVEEPTAPAVVNKPTEVENPGAEPKPYVPTEAVLALVGAYERGELFLRGSYAGRDIKLEPAITVKKVFLGQETVSVTYYDREYDDTENKKVLYTVTVDKGSFADYLGKTPTKDEDSDYIYTHLGWVDGLGNSPDLTRVTENLSLYPTFVGEKKEYDTFWEVGGDLVSENPGIPPLPSLDVHYYDFSGWEKEVDPITSNVTYRPKFDKPLAVANGQAVGVRIDSQGNYVLENVSSKNLNVSTLISRAAGSGGIIINTINDETVSFSYLEVIRLSEEGVASISLSFSNSSYEVTAFDVSGRKISDTDVTVSVRASCTVPKSEHFVFYYKDTVGKKYLTRNTYAEGVISFTANLSKTYYARTEYSIIAADLDDVKITVDKNLAAAGETVYVSVESVPGIRVDYAYVSVGDEETVIKNNSFIMPERDVTVSARYTALSYTVEFKSDGKTIVKYEFLKYGDTVTPPSNPVKVSSEKFSYEFIGWTPEVTAVTGDTVYYAQYKATPIERPELDSGVTPMIVKLFTLGVFGVCLAVAVIPASIMTVIMVIRRKSR